MIYKTIAQLYIKSLCFFDKIFLKLCKQRFADLGNPLLGVPRPSFHWKLGLPSPRLEVLQDAGWTLPAPYVVSFANRGRHPAAANRERQLAAR
ncbi:MAG: hypothetical protein DBX66_08420 [Clostridiales bacterium]|nr:MAG: hypothetical protein DBX66_08420 [Clostridiales bacterium]